MTNFFNKTIIANHDIGYGFSNKRHIQSRDVAVAVLRNKSSLVCLSEWVNGADNCENFLSSNNE